jgi:ribosomal protein L37E
MDKLKESAADHFTKGRYDRQCPKCGEWELNDMGICNHCGYQKFTKMEDEK